LAADGQISMDGKGRALDNIFTERLWRTVKYKKVYLNVYQMPKRARTQLTAYFDFYNYRRPHQSLGYLTPAEFTLPTRLRYQTNNNCFFKERRNGILFFILHCLDIIVMANHSIQLWKNFQ
jgi:hypothetical protein